MTPKSDTKFEEKLTCGSENDMRNFAHFHQSARKSQNWDFDGILLSKVENEIYRRVDNKEWCKIWRGTDMLFQNWLEEFEEFWPWHSKISKTCILMHSTINKTFPTCSTESLFSSYKKISKKAIKLASFLQWSLHLFLGHDGCFWKNF